MFSKACRSLILIGSIVVLSVLAASFPAGDQEAPMLPPAAPTQVDFERDIAPLFRQECYACHGPDRQMGGLRLDRQADAMAGGYSGVVIKPGNSADSKLIHLVAGLKEGLVMPMTGERLTPEQVGLLRAWIDQGAHWPEQATAAEEAKSQEQVRRKHPHWAFNPPQRPAIPKVENQAWVKNSIDAFVLARLEAEGIEPSPEASRATLMRRVSLDLTGLPATPEEVDQFLADGSAAYKHLVDRLLLSPHYGEKWARQWLDLARYADSDGYEKDLPRPHAWRWRHWVIDALNRNMPFDQFTIEQLAGDLLPEATLEQKVATGFHRNTLTNREGGIDLEQFRIERVMDRTETAGTVWLGVTVGCARCHDHKYDPITQKDYYQLFSFFNTAKEKNIEAPLPGEIGSYLRRRPEYEKKRNALLQEYNVAELQAEWERKTLEAADNPGVNVPYDIAWDTVGKMVDYGHEILRIPPSQRTPKQQEAITDHFVTWFGLPEGDERYKEVKYKELKEKLAKLHQEYPGLTEAHTLTENPNLSKSHILIRGDYQRPGIEVHPGTPAVLPPLLDGDDPPRLRLARWLVSKENPLTARVTVNRMWQEFFGQGLAETSSDFGSRGDLPTHPKLLDWLAVEFIDSGWNVKHMHNLLVTSATYRQSSNSRPDLKEPYPDNKLLARQRRVRLPAELVRDVTLAASGLLNPAVGGRSVRPLQPPGVSNLSYGSQLKWEESKGPDRYRRGLYIFFQRTVPYPQLINFDAPDSLLACTRRERSTTPLQALNLLNDPVFFEAAQALALRLLRERQEGLGDRIDYAFKLCLGRAPNPSEKDRLIRYYRQQQEILAHNPESIEGLFPAKTMEGVDPTEAAVWVLLSRVLLNLDEFIFRG